MTSDQDDLHSGFMDSLAGVRKLQSDKVDLHAQRPRPRAQLKQSARSSKSDSIPAYSARTNHAIAESYFQPGLSKKIERRIKTGKLDIDDVIDLHGHYQQSARELLIRFLHESLQSGYRFILIIHGKGYRSRDEAKLRPLTHNLLASHADVLAYCPALARHGGEGASYAYLRSMK